jgi:hypothetical protein
VYTFTPEEYESLREERWYRVTNGAWNNSGINHPDNIGYLMHHIGNLKPAIYTEWEDYFYGAIANKEKMLNFAYRFRRFVLRDTTISECFDYASLDIEVYYKMVACRLIYETWLGYFAEVTAGKLLIKHLKRLGYSARLESLKPEDDNKYAVDYLLYYADELICGVQVKSCNYHKSKQDIVSRTIVQNTKKNELFTSVFKVPVHYVYYRRSRKQHTNYTLVDSDNAINAIVRQIDAANHSLMGSK